MFYKRRYIVCVFIILVLSIGICPKNNHEINEKNSALDFIIPNIAQGQFIGDINNISQIEDFFDEYIPNQLSTNNIAGMTISIVHNDSISFAKGYGKSDIEANETVNASSTLFRVGSISKLFTWTAIMQLYEQGKVDLHTDINNYLTKFKIPETFDEPITLSHLMTHTAGFEETYEGIIYNMDIFPDLEEVIRDGLPPRYFKSGNVPSYSNFGAALAGYIVEQISGMDFDDYIEKNIFQRINMTSSSFRQPLPANLTISMSKSYFSQSQQLKEGFFEYLSVGPAGSMSSTAEDIAKFMITQLNNGSYQGNQILKPETLALMHTPQFTIHKDFPSIRYGYYDINLLNQTSFGHGGDTAFFHSQMSLFPKYNVGLFVSYNTAHAASSSLELQEDFIKEFMEITTLYPTNLTPIEGYQNRVKIFTGIYETTRFPHSTPGKLVFQRYLDQSFEITSNEDGELILNGLTFLEIEENLFQDTNGLGLKLYFTEDESGTIRYLYDNSQIVGAYERFDWYDLDSFHNFLEIILISIVGLSLSFWSIEGIVQYNSRRKKEKKEISPDFTTTTNRNFNEFKELLKNKLKILNWPRFIILGEVILSVIFINEVDSILDGIGYSLSPLDGDEFNSILFIPFIILLLVILTMINSILEWGGKNFQRSSNQPLKIWEKIHYSILVFTGIIWILLIDYYNLLGFKSAGIS